MSGHMDFPGWNSASPSAKPHPPEDQQPSKTSFSESVLFPAFEFSKCSHRLAVPYGIHSASCLLPEVLPCTLEGNTPGRRHPTLWGFNVGDLYPPESNASTLHWPLSVAQMSCHGAQKFLKQGDKHARAQMYKKITQPQSLPGHWFRV